MKKTLLIVALASFAMVSCKKERTCTCTTTDTAANGTVTTGQPYVTVYKKIKGGDAKNDCMSTNSENTNSYTSGGVTVTSTTKSDTKCELN